MLPFNQFLNRIRKLNLMWKLTIVNSVVIGIVIWLVGLSVKDFACYLIEQENTLSVEQRLAFVNRMDSYFIFAAVLSVIIAAIIHFYFIHTLLHPLKKLTEATKEMRKGKDPQYIHNINNDEIGQLTKNFNKMLQQIKRVEDYRDKMTQDVAHELRTPLTNINGYLEALKAGVLEGNKELYDSLYEESTRLTSLVEQLQQINVWKDGHVIHQDYKCLSIHPFIEKQIESFQFELQNQSIETRVNIENEEVHVSENGLKQVLTNLIENVLRYDKGGWMEINGFTCEKGYQIQVKNEGLSIPFNNLEQPFERFYRGDLSRNRNLGGSGLGLAIVKEIIESHNGEVGLITSQDVHTFWFTLPIEHYT